MRYDDDDALVATQDLDGATERVLAVGIEIRVRDKEIEAIRTE